tara:strand:+ start:500 stop:730 length:231 start_codon:yes stop_codon:yes gene_type:complete
MDVYIHTALAMGCIGGAYFAGKYFAKAGIENIIGSMLETLETEGYVATAMDKDGEKELIHISELIAKAVKETKKTT